MNTAALWNNLHKPYTAAVWYRRMQLSVSRRSIKCWTRTSTWRKAAHSAASTSSSGSLIAGHSPLETAMAMRKPLAFKPPCRWNSFSWLSFIPERKRARKYSQFFPRTALSMVKTLSSTRTLRIPVDSSTCSSLSSLLWPKTARGPHNTSLLPVRTQITLFMNHKVRLRVS